MKLKNILLKKGIKKVFYLLEQKSYCKRRKFKIKFIEVN